MADQRRGSQSGSTAPPGSSSATPLTTEPTLPRNVPVPAAIALPVPLQLLGDASDQTRLFLGLAVAVLIVVPLVASVGVELWWRLTETEADGSDSTDSASSTATDGPDASDDPTATDGPDTSDEPDASDVHSSSDGSDSPDDWDWAEPEPASGEESPDGPASAGGPARPDGATDTGAASPVNDGDGTTDGTNGEEEGRPE